jgi:hypothetical protein
VEAAIHRKTSHYEAEIQDGQNEEEGKRGSGEKEEGTFWRGKSFYIAGEMA